MADKPNRLGAKVVSVEEMDLSQFRAENKRLQMELEIAKSGGLCEGPPVKFSWIDTHCWQCPLVALCKVLCVSLNGYHVTERGANPASCANRCTA
jgi:hypothetical protein